MDAVKFIEERNRLCKTNVSCVGCHAKDTNDSRCRFSFTVGDEPAEQVELVERWSAAHPRKTRQSVFLEQYPNVKINDKGIVAIWPCCVEKNRPHDIECISTFCSECAEEFWSQEVD